MLADISQHTHAVFLCVCYWECAEAQQIRDYFNIKRDSRSEYCAGLSNVCVLTELIPAVKLELLPDKGTSNRQFRLISRCTLCVLCTVYNGVPH